MTITFITGANKGLGFETARRLVDAGHTVVLGARDRDRGTAAADSLGVRFVQTDVSDDDSVAAAAADILAHEGALDVIINVSSEMGSLSATHDPDRAESQVVAPLYASSKAALTMLTTQYAKAIPSVRINAVDPGYTGTDLNAHNGPQTVEEGTDAIVALATEGPGSPTGRFVNREGRIDW